MQMQHILNQNTNYLSDVISSLNIPILFTHLDYSVEALNEAGKNLYTKQEAILNKKCYHLKCCVNLECEYAEIKICPIEFIKKNLKPVTLRHTHKDEHKKKHHFEIIMHPYFDNNGDLLGVLETWYEITQYIDKEQKLLDEKQIYYHSSMYDPLTKLPNRRLLMDRIEQAIHRKSRTKKTFGLYFLDLDLFKEVNDTFGHHGGDLLLVQVANRLQKILRKGDTVARLGGDEFILIIGNASNLDHYEKIAQKIIAQFTLSFDLKTASVFIGCSIGISLFPHNGDDALMLLSCADSAMYSAKKNGRKQYAFYSDQLIAQ
ncbi:MAG: GGDEF domain-containing protein [Sulfurimonas sp.]|nr:GGDEF domain-containing protein [Sulfurimonas sp.]